MTKLRRLEQHRCFDGQMAFYRHDSEACQSQMRFSVYLPPQAEQGPVPVLYWLAGLTCTEETFMIKAGAQRFAAEHGLMLVAPDTSPRGLDIEGEEDNWDFGTGAGFYLNATQAPWADHYNMYDYVCQELPALIREQFPAQPGRQGVFGHSMGGHGALVLALRNPGLYRSVSAFAPVCNPSDSPWGKKAFGNYLGEDQSAWAEYDATLLMRERGPIQQPILIDQGTEDFFLTRQLFPERFQAACEEQGQALDLRMREGYDHSYYFISTFIEEHIRFHAERLKQG